MSSIECSDDKDCLSTWIQNKLFLSQIDNSKINELQNHIISNVFGDFNGLLTSLLKHYDDRCVTHSQQLKLNTILADINPYKKTSNRDRKSLLMLPDDCIINVMGFMDYHSKLVLQYCCRTLSIITRKPLNCNNNMKYLMSIGAYKHRIASLILSNNLNDNIQAIDMINQTVYVTYISVNHNKNNTYEGHNRIVKKIFSCDKNIDSKLAKILNKNISKNICQECVMNLMYYNRFIYKIFPSISYMLRSSKTDRNYKDRIIQCLYSTDGHGRLDDECFVFNIIQEHNYHKLLQPILELDFQDVDSYTGKILTKIASYGCIDQLFNNPLLIDALHHKIQYDNIDTNVKLKTWNEDEERWHDATIVFFHPNKNRIRVHHDNVSSLNDEWFDLDFYDDCRRIKFNENADEYLATIREILNHSNHNQRIRILNKGYFKHLDVYSRTLILVPLNDIEFQFLFESYVERWKIMNKYLCILVNSNIIKTFEKCIHENEYDFESVLNDINKYTCDDTQSVILSTMRKEFNWNKTVCDSFYCILKLILIVEVFYFTDEYIEKCIIDMMNNYYYNNVSRFPNIPSAKYFKIVNKLSTMVNTTGGNDEQNLSTYELNAILFDKCKQKDLLRKSRKSQSWKYRKYRQNKVNCKHLYSKKHRQIRYGYHRKRP